MSEQIETKAASGGSLERLARRRWLYTVTDWNDDETLVDENGDEVFRDDAKEHIATDAEAAIEADRRADLWETKQDALVARVTRHSQGIVSAPGSADRVRRMHMVDTGPNQYVGPAYVAKYRCTRCGTESEWQTARTIGEIRRGIPCPKCNPPNDKAHRRLPDSTGEAQKGDSNVQ